jgi:hypothetical protein
MPVPLRQPCPDTVSDRTIMYQAASARLGSPALFVKGGSRLNWRQNTLAEQIEAGTAIHGALDQLEPVDLAFHLAIAPGQ